ncbi:MAG: hypothetical protein AB1760_18525, partial [Pseudomonadota bacterium]
MSKGPAADPGLDARTILAKGSLYLLMAALLMGTLRQGGYFPQSKTVFTMLLLAAGTWELIASVVAGRFQALRSASLWSFTAFTAIAAISFSWTVAPAMTD